MASRRRSGGGSVIRVVIADDHLLLLEGIKGALESAADIEVVGTTRAPDRLVELTTELKPDLVVLDDELPGIYGLTLLDRLREAHRDVVVVILTGSDHPGSANQAFARGARGVIHKSASPAELAPALRAACRGEKPVVVAGSLPPAGAASGLTRREEQVAAGLGRGLTDAQIARQLHMSPRGVKFHLHNLYGKLDVHNRREALYALIERGLFGNPYNWL